MSAPKANINSLFVTPLTNPGPANSKCCPITTRPSDLKIDSFKSIGDISLISSPVALIKRVTILFST